MVATYAGFAWGTDLESGTNISGWLHQSVENLLEQMANGSYVKKDEVTRSLKIHPVTLLNQLRQLGYKVIDSSVSDKMKLNTMWTLECVQQDLHCR